MFPIAGQCSGGLQRLDHGLHLRQVLTCHKYGHVGKKLTPGLTGQYVVGTIVQLIGDIPGHCLSVERDADATLVKPCCFCLSSRVVCWLHEFVHRSGSRTLPPA